MKVESGSIILECDNRDWLLKDKEQEKVVVHN